MEPHLLIEANLQASLQRWQLKVILRESYYQQQGRVSATGRR